MVRKALLYITIMIIIIMGILLGILKNVQPWIQVCLWSSTADSIINRLLKDLYTFRKG